MSTDPARTADRLVEAAESGRLQTAGAWRDWIRRVQRLPDRLQVWLWNRLQLSLSHDAIRYLKAWRERRRRGR